MGVSARAREPRLRATPEHKVPLFRTESSGETSGPWQFQHRTLGNSSRDVLLKRDSLLWLTPHPGDAPVSNLTVPTPPRGPPESTEPAA
eukprot:15454959-Alexandrium_andersonii.AAC.1